MKYYRYLPYVLRLDSPAIISALGGDPNSSSCLPFIPGSAIRGAMARILGDPNNDPQKSAEFRDIILGGKVRYLHAYPEQNGLRALPIPISLKQEKNRYKTGKQIHAFDLTACDCQECTEQLESIGSDFLTIGSAQPCLTQPEMNARIHNQRDRKAGRAYVDQNGVTKGAIFSFEFLEPGQSFRGVIQVFGETLEECEKMETRLKTSLNGSILVGRSRKAGYGGMAAIQWDAGRSLEVEGAGCHGMKPLEEDIKPGDRFRLLLTSACMIRNQDTGQPDPGALPNFVIRLLNNRATLIRKIWAFETIGGFNRKWQLEVPQALSVSAGSVLVFEATQAIPLGDIRRLENEGLGERKEEGYGRFLFLDTPLRRINIHMPRKTSPPPLPKLKDSNLALIIEERILQALIKREIENTAAEIAQSATKLPTNSLIGRLRTPLRGCPVDGIATLHKWLAGENDAERLKRPAIDQLEACHIKMRSERMNLAEWLLRVTQQETIRDIIRLDILSQRSRIVSEESAKNSVMKKWKKLPVKLIDTVLASLAVRNKLKEGGHAK